MLESLYFPPGIFPRNFGTNVQHIWHLNTELKKNVLPWLIYVSECLPTGVKRHMTFLDLLIEVSEKKGLLTDTDIREEVDTFMFEVKI
jgi:hypothetical protein